MAVGDRPLVLVVGDTAPLERTAAALADALESVSVESVDSVGSARERLVDATRQQGASRPVDCLVCAYSADEERSPLEALVALEDDSAVARLPPILALTTPENGTAALAAGATDVLTPADPTAVVAARVDGLVGRQQVEKTDDRERRNREHARVQTILETTTTPVLVLTETGEIRSVNPAIESQTGHAPPVLEGERLSAFVHPDDREGLHQTIRTVADGAVGTTERVQVRLRTAAGTWRVVELACVSRLSDPALEGIVATVESVGAAAEVDESGDADDAPDRAVVDQLPVALCSLGPDWELRWANDAARRFLGDTPSERSAQTDETAEAWSRARGPLEGTVIWDCLPAAIRETFVERLHDASDQGSGAQFETPAPPGVSVGEPATRSDAAQSDSDGRLLVTAAPGEDGLTVSIHEMRVSTADDADSASTPAEERQRLALFEELVHALDDGIAVLDGETIEFANTALRELAATDTDTDTATDMNTDTGTSINTDTLADTSIHSLFDDDLVATIRERADSPVFRWMDPVEGDLLGPHGDRQRVDVLVAPLSDAGRTLCVVRDRQRSAAGSLSRLTAALESLREQASQTAIQQAVVDGLRTEVDAEFAGWYRREESETGSGSAADDSVSVFRPVALATGADVPRLDPPPVEPASLAFALAFEGVDGDGDDDSADSADNADTDDHPHTVRIVDDTTASAFLDRTGLRAARVLAVPITDNDVILATGSDPLAFDALETEPVSALAAAGSIALERAVARDRTKDCHRERERLAATLSHADAVTAGEREVLTAESRSAVEQRLCDVGQSLPTTSEAGSGATPTLAWFGRIETGSETVTPQRWAGSTDGTHVGESDGAREGEGESKGEGEGKGQTAFDTETEPQPQPSITIDTAATDPTARAAATQTPAVVDDLATLDDADLEPATQSWHQTLLESGVRSAVSVPVEYGGISYGVFTVYADRPNAFDERAQQSYRRLGDVAGYALSALARTQALLTDRVTELEVVLHESTDPITSVAGRLGRGLDVRAVVPRPDGGSALYCTVRELDTEPAESVPADETGDSLSALLESATELDGVTRARLVSNRDAQTGAGDDTDMGTGTDIHTNNTNTGNGPPIELVLESETIADILADHGGVLRSVVPLDGRTRLVLTVPGPDSETSPVRSIVERLEATAESTRLVARRERDARPRPTRAFDAELRDRLSDRQWRTLEAAYYGGFFAWPRESTGEEIAASLDVSQPTFSRHLRTAQRKLFDLLFDAVE
ncbi:PAS/PAC sensor protein [Natrialba magadii ATCC 43099]|uniref:PAS/PAC sensor protein n=1 Tax=Natrialba magadii (strain ATCC 43099 / DSM 3394 / CCM 3739 / CIP 104546 / IAM 13178 / JCM 8861 / NBRC 102185 / NCIMB 2190 / MS3) TaxID=547559 RepID=L9V4H6_NATMM|nr:PAS/PAC sensor protein [Natrialba magadii ATCC 43099]